jgi:hypothetical protein
LDEGSKEEEEDEEEEDEGSKEEGRLSTVLELDKFCFLAKEVLELVLFTSMIELSWLLPGASARAEYSREKEISSLSLASSKSMLQVSISKTW